MIDCDLAFSKDIYIYTTLIMSSVTSYVNDYFVSLTKVYGFSGYSDIHKVFPVHYVRVDVSLEAVYPHP